MHIKEQKGPVQKYGESQKIKLKKDEEVNEK